MKENERLKIVFVLRTNIRMGAGTEKTAYYYMKYLPRNIWDPYLLMTDFIDFERFSLPLDIMEDRIVKIKNLEKKFVFLKNIPRIGYDVYELSQYVISYLTAFYNRKIIKKLGHKDIVFAIYFHGVHFFRMNKTMFVGTDQTIEAVHGNDLKSKFTYLLHIIFFKKFHIIQKLSNRQMADYYAGVKTFLLRSGYDPDIFYPRSLSLNSKVTFLFIARLVPGKGLRTLLQAWKIAEDSGLKDAELHIIGSGELSDIIPKDESIVYHGRVEEEEMADIVGTMDFFVYPSTSDTFALVMVEALGSGCHVLTVEYFKGIYDEEEKLGYLEYLKKDPELIAEKILTASKEVNKFREQRIEQAEFIKNKYSWENVVEELSVILLEAFDNFREIS